MVEVERLSEDMTRDREVVESVGRGAFPFPQSTLVHTSPHMLAARHEGEIVGGTISEIFEPKEGEKVGLVTWIFTSEEARGLRAGEALLESTIEYLEEQDCDALIAIVEWRNTSSSKLFASHGFSRTSGGDIIDEYGLRGTAKTWWTAMYFPALGYDLWTKDVVDENDTEELPETSRLSSLRVAESFGVNIALFAVAAASLFGVGTVAENVVHVLLVPILFLLFRYLPAWVATLRDDENWRYYSWGNVYPFVFLLSVFGLFVPVPGNFAPEKTVWTYRKKLGLLGPAAAVSSVLILAAYGVALAGAFSVAALPDILPQPVFETVLYTAWFFLVVDLVVPAFPFDTYNARVVHDWNRGVWLVLAAVAVAMLVVAFLRLFSII